MNNQKSWYLPTFYIAFFSSVILMNLGLSAFVRGSNLFFMENIYPFNLPITPLILWMILLFITYAVYQFKFYDFAPISATLLLGGAWSNYIERVLYGNVADYLYLGPVYINLADIMIWAAIILINLILWGVIKKDTFGQPI